MRLKLALLFLGAGFDCARGPGARASHGLMYIDDTLPCYIENQWDWNVSCSWCQNEEFIHVIQSNIPSELTVLGKKDQISIK
jgi:hypothetical protein